MGQARRRKPTRLEVKLRFIRASLGLSQNELIDQLGYQDQLTQSNISAFERGTREPALPILLAYARVAGVCMDALVDDRLDLPRSLPSTPQHEGARHRQRRSRR